jgi:hypothetical protein
VTVSARMPQDAQRASEEARCARRREGEPAVIACFGQEGSRQSGTLPKRKTGKVAEEQSDWLANRRPSLSSLWVRSRWLSAAVRSK